MRGNANARRIALNLLAALIVLGAAGFAWVWFAPCWMGGCAPLEELAEFQAEGSQLLDIEGEPFGTLATVNRRVVPLDSLPPHLPRAFVAVEDRRFYDHGGLDFRRLFGALLSNIRAGGVAEGGSTITQQLARNLFPEWLPFQERSLRRKLAEARVARQIERHFSKEKILELYLNHIYLGSGAYGIEAAAQEYFGKPASGLSIAESATLAALPKAPSDINPKENPERARERRDLVLQLMAEAGYLSAEQLAQARRQPLEVAERAGEEEAPRGSYFIERVRREIGERVGNQFYTAGLTIYTTLDARAQRAAEEELARELDLIESGAFGSYRHPTYPEARGKSKRTGQTPYLQGAVILMDAATGEVRALVGGRDYTDSKFDRATQAVRQAGSAFKPFVYLAALQGGRSPTDRFEDAPIRLTLSGGQVWEPKNYTGTYQGPMTLRDALARSKNSVTVRVAQEVGMSRVIDTARELGVTGEIPDVPATALGAAGVRPVELAQAYATFANGGEQVAPHFIRKIVDRHGQVVWEAPQERNRVLDPGAAFVLTSMLRDVVDRGTGTAVRAVGFRGPAAGKTGTTNDAADVWFVGYTPELVGAVWMGLDNPEPIVRGASGGTLAAPVWGRIMRRVYAGRPAPREWQPPSGVSTATVEVGTGRIVGASCPAQGPTYTEYFLREPFEESCLPPLEYTSLPGDTGWVDEEWSTPLEDTATVVAPGIDWPELEALRRRMQVSEGARGEVSEPGAATAVRPAPAAGTQAPAAPTPAPAPERPAEPQQQEPRLLGEPTRRDSVSPPPRPDSTQAAQPGPGPGGPSPGVEHRGGSDVSNLHHRSESAAVSARRRTIRVHLTHV